MANVEWVVYTKDKGISGGHWVEAYSTLSHGVAVDVVASLSAEHDRVMIAKVEVQDGVEE